MNDLGLFVPGSSPVHRLPAGVKLGALVALGVASILLEGVVAIVVGLIVMLGLFGLAGFTPLLAWRQVKPLRWILLFIAVFQWWARGWEAAVDVVGVIVLLVLAASLVTLTTRTSALVDVIVVVLRPLRFLGVKPERVGLLIALGIRAVPIAVGFSAEVRDAQRARGLGPSPRAYAAPLIVKSLRHADAVGEALVARGME
ncbi:MAG: energy-coupling factor transporter transmembrane protein EcfT [Candidatus Nanopelagicales bacterium]|nr:energy-coupling factor transporter transmembrane protein EcfT [Candidatus Nanopelagicales bacterium]